MATYKVKYLLDPKNINSLNKLLTYHVLTQAVTTSQFSDQEVLATAEGSNLFVNINASNYIINDVTCGNATIIVKNVQLSNGVVQIIDQVFVPFGVFCPDTIFSVEQRSAGRISSYGFDCRAKGTSHITSNQEKPVGLAVDSNTKQLFWSNDENYPFDQPTSWASYMSFDGTALNEWTHNLIDPQGMDVDPTTRKIYYTEHQGNRLSVANYDGTGATALLSRPGDVNFQPSDVAVDEVNGFLFLATEGADYLNGTVYQLDMNGNVVSVLARNTIQNYGLCVDKVQKHVYYVQGGHGGQINCVAYGSTPCVNAVLASILEYPYMCDVDTVWAAYGGPTRVVFSQANLPGQIFYVDTDGSELQKLNTVSADLDAPMGVKFGCSH